MTVPVPAQAAHPRDGEIHDPDTRAWWHTTEALSNDRMQGRDTGSAGYQRAADYVAKRFEGAGLKPAGDNGSFFQTVPMHEVAVTAEGTSFTLEHEHGPALPLSFLHEITVGASASVAGTAQGELVFRGYCGKEGMADVGGKFVVCFGTQRQGLPTAGERATNVRSAGALGIVNVDDPYFSIEPPRWPYAYARSVTLQGSVQAGGERRGSAGEKFLTLRLSAQAFAKLLGGTGQDAAAILRAGGAQKPLPNFPIPAKLRVTLHITERDLRSPNVLAVLPGADPLLSKEYVVVAAHLDGYGFGTPVQGDNLYNGALDDAAYVALLVQMADDLKAGGSASSLPAGGALPAGNTAVRLPAPKRSLLFCAFTGEEKGLLGSNWFVAHPTVPRGAMVADINLDQLRPLFPLKVLTALAINDTTLGQSAREVGAGMGIELRADREPERQLLRRADHYPFLRAGIPAIGFVFGFDPGTEAERRYRHWYEVQYHRPQDDLTQPMDFDAAAKFNQFFYKLTETVADSAERPAFLPGSSFAPRSAAP